MNRTFNATVYLKNHSDKDPEHFDELVIVKASSKSEAENKIYEYYDNWSELEVINIVFFIEIE